MTYSDKKENEVWRKKANNFLINVFGRFQSLLLHLPDEPTKAHIDWSCIAITGWKRAGNFNRTASPIAAREGRLREAPPSARITTCQNLFRKLSQGMAPSTLEPLCFEPHSWHSWHMKHRLPAWLPTCSSAPTTRAHNRYVIWETVTQASKLDAKNNVAKNLSLDSKLILLKIQVCY